MASETPVPVTSENLAKLSGAAPEAQEGQDDGRASPSAAASPPKARSNRSARSGQSLQQRATASMHAMAIESILAVKGTPPALPTAKRKAPLSVTTTSVNFRGFVQKSGPMFYFQDNVEATLMWDDWTWTVMWMGIWAMIALHPRLLFAVPPAIVIAIVCRTYFKRFPVSKAELNASPGQALRAALAAPLEPSHGPEQAPVVPKPAHEGELIYYENLRDIQNMMRLVIDGYDGLAPLVKYLNWSSVPRTLRVLQFAIVAAIAMYVLGPYLPVRLTLLLAGEGLLLAHHPWVKPAMEAVRKQTYTGPRANRRRMRMHRMHQMLSDLLDEDRLPDWVWACGWRDVEIYENQRFRRAGSRDHDEAWSGHHLEAGERPAWSKGPDGWAPDTGGTPPALSASEVTFALEPGWTWVDGDDWRIDWGGAWSSVGVDNQGFAYTDASWQRPAPYAYGIDSAAPRQPIQRLDDSDDDEEEQERADLLAEGDRRAPVAVTRRRRWLRRAVPVAAAEAAGQRPSGAADAPRTEEAQKAQPGNPQSDPVSLQRPT